MRVLFLDLDTLRPSHLGCYGYERNTSPNIDSLAEDGLRFNNYYCPNAPCLPSRASLVSGRFGIHNGVLSHGGLAADMRPYGKGRDFRCDYSEHNLWNQFRAAGLHTVSFSTFAERHSAWWFNAGLNECHNMGKKGDESAEEFMPDVMDWLEQNAAKDNWMLHLNFWDSHTPYRAPAEFGEPFAQAPLPGFYTPALFERQAGMTGPFTLLDQNMYDGEANPATPRQLGTATSFEDLRRIVDAYDTGIRYMDWQIGRVLDVLRSKGVYDDLMIIVTSDHGESMGELGIYSEHATADEAVCHIPMLLRGPGIRAGTDDALHANVDLLPTLAEWLGLPIRPEWDGASFAETLRTGTPCGRDMLCLTQAAHVFQRAVRFEEYLYIRTIHCGYHLFPKEMLFNLAQDPYEQNNLAATHPELCAKGARLMLNWLDEMMEGSRWDADPFWVTVHEGPPHHCQGQLAGYLKRLSATGRQAGREALEKRYPNEI